MTSDTSFDISMATIADAHEVAHMTGALLEEIMDAMGSAAFRFDLEATAGRAMRKPLKALKDQELTGV